MKIILSRKGFDSTAGGVPSPIFPDGIMCSLPIPEYEKADGPRRRYEDVDTKSGNLGAIVHDLTRGKIDPSRYVHLDPDLFEGSLQSRPEGWRAVFGQAAAAEKHLQKREVGKGDLFLFFGWFREVEKRNDRWRYCESAPDLHVLFGWLQIEQRFASTDTDHIPTWVCQHPHYGSTKYPEPNSLYISKPRLSIQGHPLGASGGGLFGKYHEDLCLTMQDQRKRSYWRLPLWFSPEDRASALGYHKNISRWTRENDHVLLQTVGRGQEFVLDCQHYPEAVEWAASLIAGHSLD